MLTNSFSYTFSPGDAFVDSAPRVLTWYAFQTVVKIAYNLNIFKQDHLRMRQFFIALFCVFVQRIYDLEI